MRHMFCKPPALVRGGGPESVAPGRAAVGDPRGSLGGSWVVISRVIGVPLVL